MAKSNIEKYENSVQDGVPVECYKFTYQQMNYLYTSAANDIELQVTENNITRTEKYFAEVISRSNVKPGSTGSLNSSAITVSKDHAIAKLYQGPPPETPVTVLVYRAHEADLARFDVVLFARVSQVSFKDSQCEITVTPVSYTHLNEKIGLVMVCPITSTIRNFPLHVKLDSRTTTQGEIMCEQLKSCLLYTSRCV